jgi:uncharacterized protein YndB with AHSA1/START domain
MDAKTGTVPDETRTLRLTRIFDAPRALVFKAWTDPAMVVRWMGPRTHPAALYQNDPRPGGTWRCALRPEDGSADIGQSGVYREVVANRKLVLSFNWDPGPNAHRTAGHETLVTVELFDHGDGQTRMEFAQEFLISEEHAQGHNRGWTGSFERLDELLRAA